jgi:hypothetical protein
MPQYDSLTGESNCNRWHHHRDIFGTAMTTPSAVSLEEQEQIGDAIEVIVAF